LSKWKLWNRSKAKEETLTEIEPPTVQQEKPLQQPSEPTPEPDTTPIKEYNETLYSINSSAKPQKKPSQETKEAPKRTSWENPRTIEQNIDTMKTPQPESARTQENDDIEKKVDQILLKKKMKF